MKSWEKIVLGIGGLAGVAYLLNSRQGTMPSTYVQPQSVSLAPVTDADRLMTIAKNELHLPESGLTVRGLLPQDFGLTTFTFSLAAGWNTIVSTTAAHKAIMLTGLYYSSATPVATEVKVNMGASSVEDWGIQSVSVQQNHQYIDISPSIAHPEYPITIQVYASAASASETISFDGIVAEPRGSTTA